MEISTILQIHSFLTRPLNGRHPYIWLDAMYLKVREGGRVVKMALVIATEVKETGEREFLGLDVGLSKTEEYWTEFLRGLVVRGLTGVLLVISDAHEGLRQALPRYCKAPLGSVAGSISCATSWHMCPRRPSRW